MSVFRSERKGGAVCRNIGLENAKGNYVLFLDSDDVLMSNCLNDRVEFIENNPSDFSLFPVGTFYKEIGDSPMIWEIGKGKYLKKFARVKVGRRISLFSFSEGIKTNVCTYFCTKFIYYHLILLSHC